MKKETKDAIADFGRLMSGVRPSSRQKFILVPIATAKLVHAFAAREVNKARLADFRSNLAHKN